MTPCSAFPGYRGTLEYRCLSCNKKYDINTLLYTCPHCKAVLLLEDSSFDSLKSRSGEEWRTLFDTRAGTKTAALRGIFRFYELIAPVLEEQDIVFLGEGNTPIIQAAPRLQDRIGASFSFKNDGQNPSASFKDRGMACAFSYLKTLIRKHGWDNVLTVCASTGDTSAAAALYASYIGGAIKSVVLLPEGKVTPQQLSQPLGSGATVLELPGVFDDCMRVVEYLADHYHVALLNSKNSWRILGQESYAFEVAQWYDWKTDDLCLFIPIGNAGNITAVMNGFLKMLALGIISALPKIFGVQSQHADPIFLYYAQPKGQRVYKPVKVTPSVAQAAMIGNPVSFPRVQYLVEKYQALAGENAFHVLQVSEQEIMDHMLLANRHGHIACTQGGECLAGLAAAKQLGLVDGSQHAVLDSTAHALKFMDFQNKYFQNTLDPAFDVTPDKTLVNVPELLLDQNRKDSLTDQDFILEAAKRIATQLQLSVKNNLTRLSGADRYTRKNATDIYVFAPLNGTQRGSMLDFQWITDTMDWIAQLVASDLETLLKHYGYYAILLLTFLEGETIVIIAGAFAFKGMLNPYLIAICAFCGSFTSDQVMFSLGKHKGHAILDRFPKVSKNIDKAAGLLKKYDTLLILGFRFVYGVRNVTPIMLGLSGVSHLKFFILNFIGASVWAASFTAGGYFFGKVFEHAMESIGGKALYALLGIAVLGGLFWLYRKRKNARSLSKSVDKNTKNADQDSTPGDHTNDLQ